MLKSVRIVSWAIILLLLSLFAYFQFFQESQSPQEEISFSRDYSLINANGEKITGSDLVGRPHIVFFGFTNCPEICPTTLFEVTGWLGQLGEDANKIDAYFVTLDPEHDTSEVLSNYMKAFDNHIIGLSGSIAQIEKAAKAFHVYYKRVDLEDGDYTVDHTSSVFLFKANGSLLGTIAWQENGDTAMAKIRRLLKS